MTCIFCGIADGSIKSQLIYEDDQVVAFKDLNPQAPTHLLIIPRKHIARLSEADEKDAAGIAKLFEIFGLVGKEGNSSWFCNSAVDSTSFEVMKGNGKGVHGHIAIKTWNIERALAYLARFGVQADMSTAKYTGEAGKSPMSFVYTTMSIGGFAIHLNKI